MLDEFIHNEFFSSQTSKLIIKYDKGHALINVALIFVFKAVLFLKSGKAHCVEDTDVV